MIDFKEMIEKEAKESEYARLKREGPSEEEKEKEKEDLYNKEDKEKAAVDDTTDAETDELKADADEKEAVTKDKEDKEDEKDKKKKKNPFAKSLKEFINTKKDK